ncbi:MAG: ATP-dependent sacrificial sulfur transferase LarE [Candidatus Ancaeobacter aquaticus]|nr:ATP-dependent sacrificial sulfur transferase LarE [Candidatus Ancaeobacter aquaticus]
MTTDINTKLHTLQELIRGYKSILIGFSGGVDSTFLVKVAYDVLGDKACAVTACSSTYPEREFKEACRLAAHIGVKHVVIQSEELDIPEFKDNPVNRCYYCKKELFQKLKRIADKERVAFIADGSNSDDVHDYRPGTQALQELNIVSPLKEARLTKNDIRELSKSMDLPTWDKPAYACLSSRFPYGHEITREKLDKVNRAEDFLMTLGFRQVRVRYYDDTARIEVEKSKMDHIMAQDIREKILSHLKDIGFRYITIDLEGYRMGSMNVHVRPQTIDSRPETTD